MSGYSATFCRYYFTRVINFNSSINTISNFINIANNFVQHLYYLSFIYFSCSTIRISFTHKKKKEKKKSSRVVNGWRIGILAILSPKGFEFEECYSVKQVYTSAMISATLWTSAVSFQRHHNKLCVWRLENPHALMHHKPYSTSCFEFEELPATSHWRLLNITTIAIIIDQQNDILQYLWYSSSRIDYDATSESRNYINCKQIFYSHRIHSIKFDSIQFNSNQNWIKFTLQYWILI